MPPTDRRTLQRQFAAEMTPGGLGLQQHLHPRLTGQWGVRKDDQLICRWTSPPQ